MRACDTISIVSRINPIVAPEGAIFVEQGWIKLHRQTLENQFLMTDNNAYLTLTKLLLLVDQKTGSYRTGRNRLAEIVNINPRTLYDVLVRLENQQIINISSNNRFSVISICNWNKYQDKPNKSTNIQPTSSQQQTNNKPTLEQELRTKNKEIVTNVTKPRADKTATNDINEMFDFWNETVGYEINKSNKKNRYACSNLLKKHGRDKLKQLVTGVALAQTDRYAPTIADFSSLQFKINDLLAWGRKRGSTNEIARF